MASSSQVRQSRREALENQRLAAAQKERRNRIIFVALGVVVFAVVIALAIWGVMSAQTQGGNETPPNANSDKNGIYITQGHSAPTLEIYSDYNCPNCKTAELTLHQAMQDLANEGKINIITHALAFEKTSSRPAAIAAACSDTVGKFADYHYQLFLNQPADGSGLTTTLIRDTIPAAISLTGNDLTTFQTCFDTQATGKFADAEAKYASSQGVTRTPTFRLDGKDIGADIYNKNTGAYDPDLLRSVVNK